MATTQFCLTNAGTNLIGPTVSLLSDLDNFTSEFQTGVSLSSLQSPNCPVTLTVPDGATIVKVYDPNSNACATVNLDGNDLCTLFNLTITDLQSTTISQIIMGDITTTFGTATDYLIYWYRNNETEPQYITGKGTLFTPYSFTHPLTGQGAILAQSGEYSLKIAKIRINGINFSTLDTPPPGFVKATTSCIPLVTVTVSALNCSNGNFQSTDTFFNGYSHKFEYLNASLGSTPQSLSTTFDLGITTNYFAYAFKGSSIKDTLKITFIGEMYSDPIILEFIEIGFDALSSSIPSVLPKRAQTNVHYKKVISLEGLPNRTLNDYLIIEIIPNQTNNETIWSLYLKCLTSIDCTHCTDAYINQPYKLYGSQIVTAIQTCGNFNVNGQVEACSATSLDNADLYKYLSQENSNWQNMGIRCTQCSPPPPLRSVATNQLLNANIRSCNSNGDGVQSDTCGPNSSGSVNVTSTINGNSVSVTISFTNVANFTNVLNFFTTRLNQLRSNYPDYLNPLHANYFRYIDYRYPVGNGCGDLSNTGIIRFPLWLTYTTTSNSLTISYSQITQTQLQNLINSYGFTSCDTNCITRATSMVDTINNTAINLFTTPINIVNNTGGYYTNPFSFQGGLNVVGPSTVISTFSSAGITIQGYQNCTYMFSGNPLTLINTVPYKVCDFLSIGGWRDTDTTYNINNNLPGYQRDFYQYRLTPRSPYNPTYPDDFLIEGKIPTGGVLGDYQFAWQKFNGVVTTSSTFII